MINRSLDLPDTGTFVARIWRPDKNGPSICVLRDGEIVDITRKGLATMSDLLECENPASVANGRRGETVGTASRIAETTTEQLNPQEFHFLAPIDLQAIKACGVTFVASMLERVIEERAKGDPKQAETIRKACQELIGDSLERVVPGSDEALQLKEVLTEEGLWSQYLEVGIGPDAEIFSKSQPMSSVGWGTSIGLHPRSVWNNPEPEIVLVIDSKGQIKGASMGNDVNLRDFEGRSALLLGKSKDNNASCAIGPMIRLFDGSYNLEDVKRSVLNLLVEGEDKFSIEGQNNMSEISRDPAELVSHAYGAHHQYPDGFALFLGTSFVPTQDRSVLGEGFTHKMGDIVKISSPELGSLINTVRLSTECPRWTFGVSAFMRNLATRDLL